MSLSRLLTLCFALLWISPSWALSLQLSQAQITAGSRLTLQLELSSSSEQPPNWQLPAAWQTHFTLIEQQHQGVISPRGEWIHRWEVLLEHRQAASIERQLRLPPIQIQGQRSSEVQLRILPAHPSRAAAQQRARAAQTEPVMIEQQVETRLAYPQQTLIYELIIRYQGQPQRPRLSQLDIHNATGRDWGQGREQSIRQQGSLWEEARWLALIHLEDQPAQIGERYFSTHLYWPGASTERLVEVEAEPIHIQLRPYPSQWPAEQPWLVAKQVVLSARWIDPPAELAPGQAVELEILLQAEGQIAARLPEFDPQDLAALPAQVQRISSERRNAQLRRGRTPALLGELRQRFLITPERRLELPELAVYWWDSEQHQLQVALSQPEPLQLNHARAQATTELEQASGAALLEEWQQLASAEIERLSHPQSNSQFWLVGWFALLLLGAALSWRYFWPATRPLPELNASPLPASDATTR